MKESKEYLNPLIVIFAIIVIIIVTNLIIIYTRGEPGESTPGAWSKLKVEGGWIYGRYQYGAVFVADPNNKNLEKDDAIKD